MSGRRPAWCWLLFDTNKGIAVKIFLEIVRNSSGQIVYLRQREGIVKDGPGRYRQIVEGRAVQVWNAVDLQEPFVEIEIPDLKTAKSETDSGLTQINLEQLSLSITMLGAARIDHTAKDGTIVYVSPEALRRYSSTRPKERIVLGAGAENMKHSYSGCIQIRSITDAPKAVPDFEDVRDVHNMIARYLEIAKSDNHDVADQAMAMAQSLIQSIGMSSK